MIRRLYRTPIPESAYRDSGETQLTELSKLAALSGSGSVQSTGTSPGELTLNVQYRGRYAGRLALELSELLHSDAFTGLPYAPTEGSAEDDGYYSAESVSPGRIRPQTDLAVNVDATLARDGTRATHLQAVATSKNSRSNDFGNDQTTHIGVPASASLVRWWDGEAATEYPSPVETRSAEYGSIEIYDVDGSSYSDPTLLYKPSGYDPIGDVDVGVWDTYEVGAPKLDVDGTIYGYGEGSYGGGGYGGVDGVIQWQRVFASEHDRRGEFVIENGLLKLTLTDTSITAEQWDEGSNAWAQISLGSSSWAPVDVDVRTIAPARLEARILFSDGTSRYPLDAILSRGADKVLFARTPNATSATPQGLIDLLDPIASATIYDAGAEQTLTAREEVEQ